MNWDDELLDYGHVVTRLPDGEWWHLHFGRAAIEYQCDLLGRCTDIFACVRRFGIGVVARSPQYILTLDGEGVELSAADLQVDFRWGLSTGDTELANAGRHFQSEIMPLLYDSRAMQRAVAEVVRHGRHFRLAAPGKLPGS